MDGVLVDRILRKYGLQSSTIHAPNAGYRSKIQPITLKDGRCISIIMYKCEPGITTRIKNIHHVSRFLAKQGFPVREPFDERIMQIETPTQARYAAIYTYLPGRTIPWESYTKHHIKLLGATLSNVHASLRSCPPARLQVNIAAREYQQINEKMREYFTRTKTQNALKTKLGIEIRTDMFRNFEGLLGVCEREPEQQMLHMDFVRSNILFGDNPHEDDLSSITGILDLEKTAYGVRAFDISRTLGFLLVDCKYKTASKIRKYFLQSGYGKRGADVLDKRTRDLSEQLLGLFLMHDFYKFLRHNPYEYLEQNDHFRRTKDILYRQGLIVNASLADRYSSNHATILTNKE